MKFITGEKIQHEWRAIEITLFYIKSQVYRFGTQIMPLDLIVFYFILFKNINY